MKCPFCGHLGDKVVDSRESKEGEVIRRRRECLDCGRRFTSYERIDEIPYMVVKKDGTRERFERQKLIAGLLKACEKRPVSVAAIEARGRQGRGDAAGAAREGDGHRRGRRARDGRAEAARQGGLRPLRVGLSPLPRHRRVHERAEGSARTRRSRWPRGASPRPASLRADRDHAARAAPATARPLPRQHPAHPARHRRAARRAGRPARARQPLGVARARLPRPSSSSTRSRPPTSRCWSRSSSCWRATSSSWSSSGGAALPFARFRAKLVAVLLGMTIIPAVLVLIVGSELIRNSVDRWFNAPMDEVLVVGQRIAGDYYQEQQRLVLVARAAAGAHAGAAGPRRRPTRPRARRRRRRRAAGARRRWSRCIASRPAARSPRVRPVVDVAAPALPRDYSRALGGRAGRARGAPAAPRRATVEQLPSGGELIRVGDADSRAGRRAGARRRDRERVPDRASSRPRARRMTQRVRGLSAAARAQAAARRRLPVVLPDADADDSGRRRRGWGCTSPSASRGRCSCWPTAAQRDRRRPPRSPRRARDAATSSARSIEAFNRMAGELAASRRRLERSAVDLERKHQDVEGRRRYVETILERIATGVISVDAARAHPHRGTRRRAAARDRRRRSPGCRAARRLRRAGAASRWRRCSTTALAQPRRRARRRTCRSRATAASCTSR